MATINDFARMCNANESCKTCLIKAEMKKLYISECQGYIRRYPNEVSDIIDKWCAEHPQKTYLDEAIDMAISDLRPVSRELVEKVWRGYWDHNEVISNKSITGKFLLPSCECSLRGCYVQQEVNFCPYCGAPMTDEAVEILMKRLEKMHETI